MSQRSANDAVTVWIQRLAPGDREATERLWKRYYQQLLHLAREKLGHQRRVTDEEDVVVSVFDSFCRAAAAGRFPELDDREDLWRVLVALTVRKAIDHLRHGQRQKRGGRVRGESVFAADDDPSAAGIDQVLGDEPSPELAAMVVEQYESLLARLDDPALREIALLRLENYGLAEIAQRLDCSVRTVKRRLAMIRQRWHVEETS
jgi:RNA polymerase sigma factor (sigma-70 family)